MTKNSKAYAYCLSLATKHYENFPVASKFLPRNLRNPIAATYAFARTADDIADEGTDSLEIRLQNLEAYEEKLRAIQAKNREQHEQDPALENNVSLIFLALEDTMCRYQVPVQYYLDLLQAFKQDLIKKEYASFNEVLEYCRSSANPIGRILLHLSGNASELNLYLSDKICTALQLINFIQDLSSDLKTRNRFYFPKEDLNLYSVSESELIEQKQTPNIHALVEAELKRAEELLRTGLPLGEQLHGIFGFEIRMIIQGGLEMLRLLKKRDNVYMRPTLGVLSWFRIVWYSLF